MKIFLYKKSLIENCEKNYKQTCSKQKIANVSSVNECHKIDTSSRVRKTEHMRSRQNVPGRSKIASHAYRTVTTSCTVREKTQIVRVLLRWKRNNFSHFAISAIRVLNTPNPLQRCIKQKEKYSAVFFKNCLIFQSRPSHTGAKELTAISFHSMLMQARQTILTVLSQLRMSLTFP